jgi:hypothetical protein
MTKGDLWTALGIGLFVIVIILIQLLGGFSLTQQIDIAYINGALTATGIMIGFLTAAAISGGKFLRAIHFTLIKVGIFWFVIGAAYITQGEIEGSLTLGHFLPLQATLLFNGITAFFIVTWISRVWTIQRANDKN